MKPLLKWAGCKTWLAPRLAAMYEPYRTTHTWVEPFCGALGAALGVMPKRAILSDVNRHLINLYRQIDSGISNDAQNWRIAEPDYYLIRNQFNFWVNVLASEGCQFAQAFYYLNRTCHRGLCRFNSKGEFNTPYGHYKKPKLDHDFSEYQKTFRDWDFFDSCYGDTFAMLKDLYLRSTFIYADPPYDDGFTDYSGRFTWKDQVALATSLAEVNCPVVASNKATTRIIKLYKDLGFEIDLIAAPRRIGKDRSNVMEILAYKNI